MQTFISICPQFIINGLNASANMLVVVGLCLTTQAIWNGATTVMYVILGFVLVTYLGLGTLPLALIGIVIAFAHFQICYRISQNRSSAAIGTGTQEGDDFYE